MPPPPACPSLPNPAAQVLAESDTLALRRLLLEAGLRPLKAATEARYHTWRSKRLLAAPPPQSSAGDTRAGVPVASSSERRPGPATSLDAAASTKRGGGGRVKRGAAGAGAARTRGSGRSHGWLLLLLLALGLWQVGVNIWLSSRTPSLRTSGGYPSATGPANRSAAQAPSQAAARGSTAAATRPHHVLPTPPTGSGTRSQALEARVERLELESLATAQRLASHDAALASLSAQLQGLREQVAGLRATAEGCAARHAAQAGALAELGSRLEGARAAAVEGARAELLAAAPQLEEARRAALASAAAGERLDSLLAGVDGGGTQLSLPQLVEAAVRRQLAERGTQASEGAGTFAQRIQVGGVISPILGQSVPTSCLPPPKRLLSPGPWNPPHSGHAGRRPLVAALPVRLGPRPPPGQVDPGQREECEVAWAEERGRWVAGGRAGRLARRSVGCGAPPTPPAALRPQDALRHALAGISGRLEELGEAMDEQVGELSFLTCFGFFFGGGGMGQGALPSGKLSRSPPPSHPPMAFATGLRRAEGRALARCARGRAQRYAGSTALAAALQPVWAGGPTGGGAGDPGGEGVGCLSVACMT